jgi:hypothetical protein
MRRDRLKAAAVVEARISAAAVAVAVAASEPAVLLVEVAAGLAAPHRRAVVLQFAVAQVAAISPQVRP